MTRTEGMMVHNSEGTRKSSVVDPDLFGNLDPDPEGAKHRNDHRKKKINFQKMNFVEQIVTIFL